MKASTVIVPMVVVAVCVACSVRTFAQETKLQIQDADTVKSVLEQQMGRRVTLRLDSGAEITGSVAKVGQSLVHLSELTGRDFFDAIVPLEGIRAVIVRSRTR